MSSTEGSFPWFWVGLGAVGSWLIFTETGRSVIGAGAKAGKTALSEVPSPIAAKARQIIPAVEMPEEMVLNKGLKNLSKDLKVCLGKKEKLEFPQLYVSNEDYALRSLDDKCFASKGASPKGRAPKTPIDVGWRRVGGKTVSRYFGYDESAPTDVSINLITMGVPPKQEIKLPLKEVGNWLATNQKPEYEVVR